MSSAIKYSGEVTEEIQEIFEGFVFQVESVAIDEHQGVKIYLRDGFWFKDEQEDYVYCMCIDEAIDMLRTIEPHEWED